MQNPALAQHIACYVPLAVAPFLDNEQERWGSELRRVSVMFVNVGFSESELNHVLDTEGALRLHNVFSALQRVIFDSGGTVNKFLVDDKGSTLVAVFGLPPLAHKNDATRAALCSLAICGKLHELQLPKCAVGVTSGTAFCGVVGHRGGRREYTVLGDVVNLAARLMQHAATDAASPVIIDAATHSSVHRHIDLEPLPSIRVKGKSNTIQIFCPSAVHGDRAAGQGDAGEENEKADGEDEIEQTRAASARAASSVGDVFALEWRRHVQQYSQQHTHEMTSRPVSRRRRVTVTAGPCDPLGVVMQHFDACGAEGVGRVVVVEGGVGSGKTRLLSRFLAGASASAGQTGCWRLAGAGNAFERGALAMGDRTVGMALTLDVMRQAVSEARRVEASEGTVGELLQEWATHGGVAEADFRQQFEVLNAAVGSSFPLEGGDGGDGVLDDSETSHMQQQQKQQSTVSVLAGIIAGAVLSAGERGEQVVLAIDDASLLSRPSWWLLRELIRFGEASPGPEEEGGVAWPLLIMLAMQPRHQSRADLFRRGSGGGESKAAVEPPQLLGQKSQSTGHNDITGGVEDIMEEVLQAGAAGTASTFQRGKVVLRPLSAPEVGQMACDALNVFHTPASLQQILFNKSEGNPLFVLELIGQLLADHDLVVDAASGTVTAPNATRREWVDDRDARCCARCQAKFTPVRRKHRTVNAFKLKVVVSTRTLTHTHTHTHTCSFPHVVVAVTLFWHIVTRVRYAFLFYFLSTLIPCAVFLSLPPLPSPLVAHRLPQLRGCVLLDVCIGRIL